jgi:hypothetical protein
MPFHLLTPVDSHHFIESPDRVPKKFVCALAASLLVSPLVSIIDDKCLVQEIAGIKPLMVSIKADVAETMKNGL